MSSSRDEPPPEGETVLDQPSVELLQSEGTALDRPAVDLSRRGVAEAEPDTELDRPTIDPGTPATVAPKLASARRRHAPDPSPARPSRPVQARASQVRVTRGPVDPKADMLLYVGLGVTALLILLICVGIAIGFAGGFD